MTDDFTATEVAIRASMSPAERLARAVLLFHSPDPWSGHRREMWRVLTGTDDATTRNLCELARQVRHEEEVK